MKIWRYLRKEKFIKLLADKGIFLAPASKQSDPEEGIYDHTYPRKLVEAQPRKYTPVPLLDKIINPNDLDSFNAGIMQKTRERQYLSSWFAGDNKSAEMWKKYASDGVAIVSTNKRIISNTPQPIELATDMGLVKYSSEKKRTEIHKPLTVKYDDFSYENEFRIIFTPQKFSILAGYNTEEFGVCYLGNQKSFESEEITSAIDMSQINNALNFIRKKGSGYLLLYPLTKIITEIRISPYCTEKQEQELKNIINNSGLNIPVVKSEINKL